MEEVFGYVRVSTETQVKSGYGADSQEQAIREWCKANNKKLVKIFYDLGESGTVVNREGLTDLLVSFNGVRRVVVLNTSRLWRSDTAKVLIKREIEKMGADVISIEQPTYSVFTRDPHDFLMQGFQELLDAYDRMSTNMKLAKGRKTKAKSGVKACGEAPIGYKWQHDGVDKPIVVVEPDAVHIVTTIFKKYLELGSVGKVRKFLNEQGFKTNRGKDFSDMSVLNILKNDFYVGKVRWNDMEQDGQHEPVISKITFGKVQAQLQRQNKRSNES
ncbi:recombinase family protein [Tumebacillus permanentifrigoris]|uniref:DNA invertase Pin-like site-specific DNA recombinase n=1 Tax=Tumebacillus permanentifrigoris TaxID=378543 RepID=A0A316D794_9BACL|nr:recombinase family protein [Tumebacillus permanentifrigoris]PWK08477.1 DNA invertase Pin-like site-specific DNA recombinase [Tumebacillus permanentifrigoris]